MFMLTIKRKVTFHKIYHRPQGEFNIGVWVTNPKASEFGLKAHSELTSLCMVDVHEKNSTTLPEVPAWMNWNEALTLTLNFPMCLSDAPLEGLLPSSWCVFEAQNKKKQLKIVTKWSKLTGTISITQKQVLLPETNMPAWVSLGSTWMGGGITIEVTTAVDYSLPSWQAIKNSTVVVVFFPVQDSEAHFNQESGSCRIWLHVETPEVYVYWQISILGIGLKCFSRNYRRSHTKIAGIRKLFSYTCSAGAV